MPKKFIKKLKENLLNSNQMDEETFGKLKANIKKQRGRHPAVIVREIADPPTKFDKEHTKGKPEGFRIIDGHNRVRALKSLGYKKANCDVWDIDDETEMLLLATLNELKGSPDVVRRAKLLDKILNELKIPRDKVLELVPEGEQRLEYTLGIIDPQRLGNIADGLEAERESIKKRLIAEGTDPARAGAMADIYTFGDYVPDLEKKEEGRTVGERFCLAFFFENEEEYEKVENFFEGGERKETNSEKLIDLIT